MKAHRFKNMLLTAVIGVIAIQTTAFAEVEKLSISQIAQKGNDVYLYISMLDEENKPASESFSAEQFEVSIDKGEALQVQEATAFQSLNQGASYVFCVDVSKSVTEQEMEEIRSSISDFINGMSANDYARIITIGSEITSVCEATQDKSALNSAVQGIGRTADYTYLYKGISFALDGQRKSVETIPVRAAVILFTDGMDDSDGASGEEQVLLDLAETRIPIYVVGLKGNDENANLNSVGQIARQSGGSVFSYNDMSIAEAVQTIGDTMRSSCQLHFQPPIELFGQQNLVWNVNYNSGSYSVASTNYVYSLSMDDVVKPVAETEAPETEAPETQPPTEETEPVTEPPAPEKSGLDKFVDFVKENIILCGAVGLVVIALIILLVSFLQRNAKNKQSDWQDINDMDDDIDVTRDERELGEEKTVFEDDYGEETIGGEETIDGSMGSGARVEFEITFGGRTETVERVIRDQVVLGRGIDSDVDVVLNSSNEDRRQTSRQHAFIFYRPDGLYVKDNSKNKTYLNGMEVLGEVALRDGDVLRLGKATVRVQILSA